jgi:hypothetical protein
LAWGTSDFRHTARSSRPGAVKTKQAGYPVPLPLFIEKRICAHRATFPLACLLLFFLFPAAFETRERERGSSPEPSTPSNHLAMWYYFAGSSPQANSPNDLMSPSTKPPGSAAAVTPATQMKSPPPPNYGSASGTPQDTPNKASDVDDECSPAWTSRYTDHLVEQVALAGASGETEPLKAPRAKKDRTPTASAFRIFQEDRANATPMKAEATLPEPLKAPRAAPVAARADRTPTASAFHIFQDDKANATPIKAEATQQLKRNGGRRPLSLTPKGGLSGLFMLSPSRFSVSPLAMPFADSTNRPDNVTPPNATGRPRLQKRAKKVKSVRRLEEAGVFDQENIAPKMTSNRGMLGFVVV